MRRKEKTGKSARRSERELDKLVSRTGLKGSAREMARQYGRGMLEGMHIAYLAVAERLLRAGNTKDEVSAFFDDMLNGEQVEALLREAEHSGGARIA